MKKRRGGGHLVKEKQSDLKEIWSWIRALAAGILIALVIRQFLFGVFIVNGESMLPTLENREALLVNKLAYEFDVPNHREVIVFHYPAQPNIEFIKRVIGLPGDKIKISEGRVYRNGQLLEEPYLKTKTQGDYGPVIVPPGSVFVLGDNRLNSLDSRDPSVGMVPINEIVGRAEMVLWPELNLKILSAHASPKGDN
jgi:signal peptidase I